MELKYLQTFKTILETGSFIGAARKLSYTQSTVTFQIQQLENELSVKLFEKIGRRMVLTQVGRDILPYVDTILQNVGQLKNYGKNEMDLRGELHVAMPESLLTYKMQPVIQAFRAHAPNVRMSLRTLNCYTIREQVVNGHVDMGIHYDVGGYGTSMIIDKLDDYSLVLIASPELKDSDCDFITHNQRKDVCLLINDRESIYHKMFDGYLRDTNIVLDGIMEVGSIEAIKRSVVSNLGVAFLPRFVVHEELEQGIVKEIKTQMNNKIITAVCIHHKNKWITPAMELFIRLSRQYLSTEDAIV